MSHLPLLKPFGLCRHVDYRGHKNDPLKFYDFSTLYNAISGYIRWLCTHRVVACERCARQLI